MDADGDTRIPSTLPASVLDLRENMHAPAGGSSTGSAPSSAPSTAESSAPASAQFAPEVPGYDLLRILGQGGMGVVWEAVERRFERRVALKVHVRGAAANREEIEMEARLAARIEDPGVVRIYDVGRALDGASYFTMELVEGRDLAAVLEDGPLPPARAVTVMTDVARAVGAAHALGIVHRDLKPKNIMLDRSGRARVLDFGVALHDRTANTSAFLTIGTPPYMSPEQVSGLQVGPSSDVYALGVVLFRLLSGRLPFTDGDPGELARKILVEPPPSLQALVPAAHDDLVWVVEKCLEKEPAARFPDAAALSEALLDLSEGRVVHRVVHRAGRSTVPDTLPPSRKPVADASHPRREDAKKQFSWTHELAASPAALWPYVGDTDRFNHAVGLAPVVYETVISEVGEVKRTGKNTSVGLEIAWEEHPFEWVREQFHEVRRSYHQGPLSILWNRVSLIPREGGGTTLLHEISLDPRGVLGTFAAFIEIERRLGSAMTKVYAHIDAIASGTATDQDPFEPPHRPKSSAAASIEEGKKRLLALGFEPKLVSQLTDTLLRSPTTALAKMRPHVYADSWGQRRDVTLDLFLHAADSGLLDIAWDLVCPRCRVAHDVRSSLADLQRSGRCTACAEAYENDLLTSVELVFQPHEIVRDVPRATYCIGAPSQRPHILAQVLLAPGETRVVSLDLAPGSYQLIGPRRVASADLLATAVAYGSALTARVTDARIDLSAQAVRAGTTRLVMVNETRTDALVRLESMRREDAAVSAAVALTHPTFRELFGQLLTRGEHFSVSHAALLFLGPADTHAVYRVLGDADGATTLADLEGTLASAARRESGAVIQHSQGISLCSFPSMAKAVRVARAVLEEAPAVPGGVKAAVHGGRVLALGRSGSIELAGATVSAARALFDEASAETVALSEAALRDEATRTMVQGVWLQHHTARQSALAGQRVTLIAKPEGKTITPAEDATKIERSSRLGAKDVATLGAGGGVAVCASGTAAPVAAPKKAGKYRCWRSSCYSADMASRDLLLRLTVALAAVSLPVVACGETTDSGPGEGVGNLAGRGGAAGSAGGVGGRAAGGAAGGGSRGGGSGAGGSAGSGAATCFRALPALEPSVEQCRGDGDCSGGGGCLVPGQGICGGDDGPGQPLCDSDGECGVTSTGVQLVCQPQAFGGSLCRARCVDDLSCAALQRCDGASGHCEARPCVGAGDECSVDGYCRAGLCAYKSCNEARPCRTGFSCSPVTFTCAETVCAAGDPLGCPEHFSCKQEDGAGRCARTTCACDTQCGGEGVCVKGECYASAGYCPNAVCGRPLLTEQGPRVAALTTGALSAWS